MENNDYIEEGINVENKPFENEFEEKIFKLDIRAQELEILLDQIEEKALKENEDPFEDENYIAYKNEYKQVIKERKQLKKELQAKDTSKLNQVSVWILIYGTLIVILSFPFITGTLWLDFANLMITWLSDAFSNLTTGDFIYKVVVFLVIFSLPLLINLVTWLIYVNLVKSKLNKKVFIGFWVVQGLMSLGMIIFMCTQLYGA